MTLFATFTRLHGLLTLGTAITLAVILLVAVERENRRHAMTEATPEPDERTP